MQQHGSKYFAPRPLHPDPWDWVNRSNSTFSEQSHVAYQIKGTHEMRQHGSKHFARRPLPPNLLTLGLGSKGQNSTFSEHRHVAYRIIGNHKMQQHGSIYFACRPPSLPPSPTLEMGSVGQIQNRQIQNRPILFQSLVMLHIKLKQITDTVTLSNTIILLKFE